MRKRLLVIPLALAVGGAAWLDAASPPPLPRAPSRAVAAAAGTIACPVAAIDDGRGYLHLANAGAEPSRVRVTVVARRGRSEVLHPATLAPGAARTIRLHRRVRGTAGAIVEYAGGEVVATHGVWLPRRSRRPLARPGDAPGGAAAACARPGPAQTVVAGARTLRAESRLALLNPGAADAEVTVSLLADRRPLFPQRLQRRVVPPHAVRLFSIEDFAFDARDVTAVVTAGSGRVVAEILVRAPTGVSLAAAQVPAASSAAIAAAGGVGAAVGVVAIGEDDAQLDSRMIRRNEQGKAPRVPPALRPGEVERAPIPAAGAAAFAFGVGFGSPAAAATTWIVERPRGRDRATAEAAVATTRWVAAIGSPTEGFVARAIVAVPGAAPATVAIRTLGRAPRVRTLTVPAGRLRSIALGAGEGTFAIEVVSDAPVVVAVAATAVERSARAFGLLAVPLVPPSPVAVVSDLRAGNPAPSGGV